MSSRPPSPGPLPFDEYVQALAAAIADGTSIDWAEAEARAQSVEHQKVVRRLRAIANLAAVHRSGDMPIPAESRNVPSGSSDTVPEFQNLASVAGGRFIIERRLGKGGFGVVYQAYDQERKAHLALKSLNRADLGSIYDLKKEFRVLADLSHPNLVSLYELFADRDWWFIAMELVKGVDFLTYVRNGIHDDGDRPSRTTDARSDVACDLKRLEGAVPQLVQALCYLHAQNKLHRDIKPSNVLVTDEGHLKLLDFGLATDLIPGIGGETLRIRGTPAYVSPEQAAGRPATQASDWYGVGVILFEALTGERPFSGTFSQVLEAKQHQDAPAASSLRGGVPERLDVLCADLLARHPTTRPSDADVVQRLHRIWPASAVTTEIPVRRSEQTPFIGRKDQLDVLNWAFEASTLGRAQTAFVHGGSGMGKTALVRRFLDLLNERESGVVILEGRCYERESVPYKALDSLVDRLCRYLRMLPRAEAEALLPRDVTALTRLFPILRRVDAVAEVRHRPIQVTNEQELRRRGFAAFRELLARISDRHPVVLVIDDLQWSDTDSAALIADLILTAEPPPLLFIACYRSEEAVSSAALSSLLLATESSPRPPHQHVHHLAIDELTAAEAYELATALSHNHHATASAESIVRESGRSPFFITELIRYSAALMTPGAAAPQDSTVGQDRPPDLTLDSVIRARTSRLADGARRLLRVLAVFAGPLDLSVAIEAAELTLGALTETTALRAAHLTRTRLAGAGEKIEIYHDRIREAIVAQIPAVELRQLHGRLAVALERSADVDPETLVIHFHGAGQNDSASSYAVMAADRAREALAFDRAARQYRFALDFGQFDSAKRREIQIRLGDALAASGRGYDAAQAYLAAAERALAAELLELKRRAAEQLLQSGHIDEGFRVVRDVLGTVGLRLATTPRQALVSLLVQRARIKLRGLQFRERDRTQVSAEALVRVDTCWSVATGLAIVDYIRAAEFQARHLLLALRTGEPYRVVRALAMELAYSSIGGVSRQKQNEKLIGYAERLAERVDNPEALALVTLVKGSAAYMQGRWAAARALCENAERVMRERCTGVAWQLDTAQFYALLSLFYLGGLSELSRRLPTLLKEARERDALYAETNLRSRISYVGWLAADDPEQARREVRQGMERWSQQGFHIQHYYEMLATAEISLYSGSGIAAWTGLEQRWRDLRRSFLLRVQPVLIESLYMRARAALAASTDPSVAADRRASLIKGAERDAARLAREGAAWADALSELILSGASTLRGNPEGAVSRLNKAETAFQNIDMHLHAAVTRRRRGELVGGREGQLLVQQADSWMAGEVIHDPARFAEMLAPGVYTRR